MQLLVLTLTHFLAQSLTHNFTRTHKHQRTTDALFKTNYHWRCTCKAHITMRHVRYWHVWRSHRCNTPSTEHKNIYGLKHSNNIKTKKAKQFVLHETGIEPGLMILDGRFPRGRNTLPCAQFLADNLTTTLRLPAIHLLLNAIIIVSGVWSCRNILCRRSKRSEAT